MSRVVGFDIESDEVVGGEGGFLAIRRLRMRNRRADGTSSERFLCDFLARPVGLDAVVVAVFARHGARVDVLLRDGLRPALALGRDPASVPVADARPYLFLSEVVAGIIESDDRGEAGVRHRAALEVAEEAGFAVADDAIVSLGAGSFPSPGSMPEKFWLTAVEVDPATQGALAGDGSPLEEDARTRWLELDAAIAGFVSGELEDAKSELALRRLRDHLGYRAP